MPNICKRLLKFWRSSLANFVAGLGWIFCASVLVAGIGGNLAAYICYAIGCAMIVFAVASWLFRRGGVVSLLVLAVLVLTVPTAAKADGGSDWFGGYTITPSIPDNYQPPNSGCRDIDDWHTGRFVGKVDYEFHLYAHWCWALFPSGVWDFTNIRIRTSITKEGGTAKFEGVYQHTNDFVWFTIGEPGSKEMMPNACLKVIRKAQITHHLIGVPYDGLVGHAVVSVLICADGSVGYQPYHSIGQL